MAGLILLVAMISSIVLTLYRRTASREQVIYRQHYRNLKSATITKFIINPK